MTGRLNENMEFVPIGIAVMTISDSRTPDNDKSGDLLASRVIESGHHLISRTIVHDDVDEIRAMTKLWIEDSEIDAVITTGEPE